MLNKERKSGSERGGRREEVGGRREELRRKKTL